MRQTVLAIIRSSSVRMTRTATRLTAAEITPSVAATYPQQRPDVPSGLTPPGADRNFCLQPSQQK